MSHKSKAVIARFEAERQALALMDHPHIAREECVTQRTRLHGPLHSSTLHQQIRLAPNCFLADEPDRGRAALDALERDFGALKARSKPLELDLLTRLLELGQDYMQLKETDKAFRWYREAGLAFGTGDERFKEDPQAAIDFILSLADNYAGAKQVSDALTWYERYADALVVGWTRTDGSPAYGWLDCDRLIGIVHGPQDLDRVSTVLSKHVTFVRTRPSLCSAAVCSAKRSTPKPNRICWPDSRV